MLKVEIDYEASAAYVYVAEGEHARTIELESGRVYVDVDPSGCVLGIEVLGAKGDVA